MSKKFTTTLVLLFFLLGINNTISLACGFDFVGDCATSAQFSINGVNSEYLISNCPYGNSLSGNLGTNLTELKLTYASTRTWESCTNNVMQGAFWYRIYNNAAAKGNFQKVNLTQKTLVENPPYRTKLYYDNLSINLLSNLQNNTVYTMEVYFEVNVDSDGNGIVDTLGIKNNSGVYYSTQFQTGNINIAPAAYNLTFTQENVTCNSATDGMAIVKPIGGKAPFQYSWSNGAMGDSVKNLKAGTYFVAVTDSTNAKVSSSIVITEPSAIISNLQTTQPSCKQINGSIIANPIGGTAPYKYLWSTRGDTSISISNLAIGTYSVTVTDAKQCIGTANTTLTENCGQPGSYCNSNALAPWNEWIARVQIGLLDNISSKSRPDKYAQGYSDWKDKSVTLTTGQSYTLNLTPGLSYSTYKSNLFFRVWIDWNGNGILEDSEIILEKNAVSIAVTQTVLIPLSAKVGTTLMRVSMKQGAYPTACETFNAGEVEDYTVNILNGVPVDCTLDSIPPVLTNCPTNINLITTDSVAVATWSNPTISDNCTTTPSVSSNFQSGSIFKLGTTNIVITVQDAKNNTAYCRFSVIVTRQAVDSNTVKKDLGLLVESSSATYTRFTTQNFKVKITNTASTPYTNIKVQFKYPQGTAHGGTVIPSLGIWTSYCAGGVLCYEWNIPSLAANSTATLDLPLFILDINTPLVATAQLLNSVPIDTNRINNTATITLNPDGASSNLDQSGVSIYAPVAIKTIYSTLTEDNLSVDVESLIDKEVSFIIYNTMGKVIKLENKILEKGLNHLQFDVWNLQGGMYFIVPSNNTSKNASTKFVKI